MVKQRYKNNQGFSLVESVAVLMIVSIIVIILSRISINSYDKYQERLAINEMISDIYKVQTDSLNNSRNFIYFFENNSKYLAFYEGQQHWKKLNKNGKPKLGASSVKFEYRKGNLVSKAYTLDVQFDNSRYRVIIHLDTGYITLDEV
ncbi:prepilin-type N-terminal cleavage/methylation domain-containing protein [uncultured Gemella sp.]|uniref:prepilin-type N-terminal cleavage/methylation domain-containing protein n=1 Tax=uncultured Gemella sp. TaxID=254352 RepID=UPI0028D7612B|nr:prepilin-type N-terminal cleavage/methylation domain-containing protein [uncultured Gemella sp.]